MQIHPRAAVLLALLLPFAACSGEKDAHGLISEGNAQLRSADHEAAVASFEAALSRLNPAESALRRDAELGRCEALAFVDAPKAQVEFTALAGREELSYSAYRTIALAFADASKFDEAADVLKHGLGKHPAEEKFIGLARQISDMSDDAGEEISDESRNGLSGIGYLGND